MKMFRVAYTDKYAVMFSVKADKFVIENGRINFYRYGNLVESYLESYILYVVELN